MIKDQNPFSSDEHLRETFEQGLQELLRDYDELGVFILVLANAVFDQNMLQHLAQPLAERLRLLEREISNNSEEELEQNHQIDDLQVFQQLHALGLDSIEPPEYRRAGPWEVQFNQLRSFRPTRSSKTEITGITRPFDREAFHFNKQFLRKEILWEGELNGRSSSLFYNKYPFVPLHALLVPERMMGWPQLLNQLWLEYLWAITARMGKHVPGIGFAYNSYGANASVNHLHFHMFVRNNPLPIAADIWEHNGGEEAYPIDCYRFTSATAAWKFIDKLHEQEVNYNLLATPNRLYCVPRNRQGSYSHSGWSEGFAWYEMSGGITMFSKEDFNRLTADEISDEIASLKKVR